MKKIIAILVGCGMVWYGFSRIFRDFSFENLIVGLLVGLLGIALILVIGFVSMAEYDDKLREKEREEDREKRELDEAAKKQAWYEARKEAYKKEYKDQMQ